MHCQRSLTRSSCSCSRDRCRRWVRFTSGTNWGYHYHQHIFATKWLIRNKCPNCMEPMTRQWETEIKPRPIPSLDSVGISKSKKKFGFRWPALVISFLFFFCHRMHGGAVPPFFSTCVAASIRNCVPSLSPENLKCNRRSPSPRLAAAVVHPRLLNTYVRTSHKLNAHQLCSPLNKL